MSSIKPDPKDVQRQIEAFVVDPAIIRLLDERTRLYTLMPQKAEWKNGELKFIIDPEFQKLFDKIDDLIEAHKRNGYPLLIADPSDAP